ncbi:MAG: hypothetical protein ACE5I7_18090 [Candidatus Binatia bacterium]
MSSGTAALPKVMLGFVVRRCAVALGHRPTPQELATWANNYRDGERSVRLFGRPISVQEAALILRHPGRAVTARCAAPYERTPEEGGTASASVTSFASAVRRLKARAK